MAILSPTNLETANYGTTGWNAIYSSNFQKLNTYLAKFEDLWNITASDWNILRYSSSSGKWIKDTIANLSTQLATYLAKTDLSNVNDTTILNKLLNVDGSGSGLDADTVDTFHASQTPTPNTIPVSDAEGYINAWVKQGEGSGLGADTVDGKHASDLANVDLSNVDDITILNKLKNVDGTGSGLDADKLQGLGIGFWNAIPKVGLDGVMEVGKYIDFHLSADSTADHEPRLYTSDGQNLRIKNSSGDFIIWHSGNDGAGSGLDADTVDTFHASQSPTANQIPVLNAQGQLNLPFNTTPILISGQDFTIRTLYVDPVNGSDNNTGTQTAPFATLQKAISAMPAGGYANIILLNNYTLSSDLFINNKTIVIDLNSYTLTVQSYSGATYNYYYGIKPKGTVNIRIQNGILTLSGKANPSLPWRSGSLGSFIKGEHPSFTEITFSGLTINMPTDAGYLVVSGIFDWAKIHNLLFETCTIVRDGGYILNIANGVATLSVSSNTTLQDSLGNPVSWSDVITNIVKDANGVPRNIVSNIVL